MIEEIKDCGQELAEQGFAITEALYEPDELENIQTLLDRFQKENDPDQANPDVFAIRQLLNKIPELYTPLFNERLRALLLHTGGAAYFLTKAIYFNKPPGSNWFVAYHQDLSISVTDKLLTPGYSNWTFRRGQHGVQPPLDVLENTITIRIHLDDTDAHNGALRVISGSHLRGVVAVAAQDWDRSREVICQVNKGSAMLMKPLTLHASDRTTNNQPRRVIHLEFNKQSLAPPLQWLEYKKVF